MVAAQAFVDLLEAYAALGAAFALAFVTAGVGRVDPSANGAGIGFRMLIFRGVAALWPVLLKPWLQELGERHDPAVELRVGSPIPNRKLLEISTAKERTEYLRWRTYLLAGRNAYEPRTSLPLLSRSRQRRAEPVRAAGGSAAIANEIASLDQEHLLAKAGDLKVTARRRT